MLSLGTQSEIAPSSDRAERRADGSHTPTIIIRHNSINMTVPGGDPEAVEHNFATKPVWLFFCSRPYPHAQHLTDFSELELGGEGLSR